MLVPNGPDEDGAAAVVAASVAPNENPVVVDGLLSIALLTPDASKLLPPLLAALVVLGNENEAGFTVVSLPLVVLVVDEPNENGCLTSEVFDEVSTTPAELAVLLPNKLKDGLEVVSATELPKDA